MDIKKNIKTETKYWKWELKVFTSHACMRKKKGTVLNIVLKPGWSGIGAGSGWKKNNKKKT